MSDLWQRIEWFDIDGKPVALTFPLWLARENGWTVSFGPRVVTGRRAMIGTSGAPPAT